MEIYFVGLRLKTIVVDRDVYRFKIRAERFGFDKRHILFSVDGTNNPYELSSYGRKYADSGTALQPGQFYGTRVCSLGTIDTYEMIFVCSG